MTGSPVLDYMAGRERVLGRRTTLSDDLDLAAEQLAERHGGDAAARRWAVDLLAAIDRRTPRRGHWT